MSNLVSELESKNCKLIIQARLGSSRLKNKILLPFYKDKSILDLLLDKLIKRYTRSNVLLAISEKDETLAKMARKYKIDFYKGCENNVLKRIVETANVFNVNRIIRICSDNPFLDLKLLDKLIENHEGQDYIGYAINEGQPAIKTHLGFFAEGTTKAALESIMNVTSEMKYLEHVTNYFYTNPDTFNIQWLSVPSELLNQTNLRLTVDTLEDFNLAKTSFLRIKNRERRSFLLPRSN